MLFASLCNFMTNLLILQDPRCHNLNNGREACKVCTNNVQQWQNVHHGSANHYCNFAIKCNEVRVMSRHTTLTRGDTFVHLRGIANRIRVATSTSCVGVFCAVSNTASCVICDSSKLASTLMDEGTTTTNNLAIVYSYSPKFRALAIIGLGMWNTEFYHLKSSWPSKPCRVHSCITGVSKCMFNMNISMRKGAHGPWTHNLTRPKVCLHSIGFMYHTKALSRPNWLWPLPPRGTEHLVHA